MNLPMLLRCNLLQFRQTGRLGVDAETYPGRLGKALELEGVGRCPKPILLQRGMSATVEELLCAAEYVMKGGNSSVMLCERGIRTFETCIRNTMDLNAVPMLKRLTHLPVIGDPSHGTGHWWMVPPLSRAATAVGADGLLVEVHCDPQKALSDGPQTPRPDRFDQMMRELRPVALAVAAKLHLPWLSQA